ncbi:MAG: flagellar hook-basal body complex protein FliE [Chitinivibrionales bacterium]|nr:flagellar hook-basal body complex protein FliE [Chitinivibrionales bacterium]
MAQINPIGPVEGGKHAGKPSKLQPPSGDVPSFKDTLKGVMKDVNDMQVKADKSIEKMVAGEITDVHQVMTAVQEANVAFNTMMEIRNKVMDAYQELMRMRL